MTSRLTVITGPRGADIGPVAAKLGRGLDDGFAIRVVRSNVTGDTPHTSPDPFHRHTLDEATGCRGTGDDPCSMNFVKLSVLPSAWQDPQTNLGVVYDAQPDTGLEGDVHTLDALGLNPAHRVTVQCADRHRLDSSIPAPVEVGNVGVQARDAVLRAGGRVQIEAGDGQTFLQALATVGLPPWASWIGHLDRWIVLDVDLMSVNLRGTPQEHGTTVSGVVQRVVEQLDGSSGAYHNGQYLGGVTLRVALMNAQLLIPGIAAHDYNVATGEGDIIGEGTEGEAVGALTKLLDAVTDKTGVEIHLMGTGRIEGTGVWSWIESGEHTG